MRTIISMVLAVMVSAALCGSAAAAMYDHRENVNILNTLNPDMKITDHNGTQLGSSFRMFSDGYSYGYEGGVAPIDGSHFLVFDFGEVQNVKTIRMVHGHQLLAGDYDVYTSVDGQTYTLVGSSTQYFNNGSVNSAITLDLAVDTQYLKLVPTSYMTVAAGEFVVNTSNRLYVQSIRVFGDVGTLDKRNIDLIASTGLAGGSADAPVVVMTTSPGISTGDGISIGGEPGAAMMMNHAANPPRRMVIYGMGQGSWLQVEFTNGVEYEFTTLGLSGSGNSGASPDATYLLEILTGEGQWETVFDDFMPFAASPFGGYFALPEGTSGTAIKLTMLDTGGGSNFICDIQLFGAPVPEPMTMSLLALGGLALLRRRRR